MSEEEGRQRTVGMRGGCFSVSAALWRCEAVLQQQH